MNVTQGRIISIVAEGDIRRARVIVDPAAICPRCAAGKGCGAGLFGSSGKGRELDVTLAAGLVVAEGDTVSLDLEPRNVLAAAGIVYGWPLAGAAIGAGIAFVGVLGDLAAALLALSGLLAGLAVARWRLAGEQCLERFTPRVVA